MANYMDVYRQKTPLSEKLFKRPGGHARGRLSQPSLLCALPSFRERAKGSRFRDVDDHEYIDLWMGTTPTSWAITPTSSRRPCSVRQEGSTGHRFEKQVEWAELVQELIPAPRGSASAAPHRATMYVARLAVLHREAGLLKIAGGWHGQSDLTSLSNAL